MKYPFFNSRNEICHLPIGALAEGNTLRLSLFLEKNENILSAFLVMIYDGETEPCEILLTKKETSYEYDIYSCELELDEGLYFYCFKYKTPSGEFFITKDKDNHSILSKDGAWWQQTVYKQNFSTPDWIKGGIIYQIFPDRFYNSKALKPNVPEDRFVKTDTSLLPEHRQNNGKCSLGNDYYCGDLKGIIKKLSYIAELGVNCIYLNPIFEAHSNHRYNTADYFKIDPLLGDEEDFIELCKEAKKHNISIILDGVFSHTGDDSIYFNAKNRYDSVGAVNSPDSPYKAWYKFKNYPDEYEEWWGVKGLPETDEENPDFIDFITGDEGVLRYWLKKGAMGWRLDVADELPDIFLDNLRKSIKSENKDAFILGEVWEDATNKISYDKRRKFLRGEQLDSVMNYPFANAIVDFIKKGNASELFRVVLDICENYPKESLHTLMNHIGTHDTVRIITNLMHKGEIKDREWQSKQKLSDEDYKKGLSLLKLAAIIQYTLPGIPSLYYGDEIGMEGYSDPFCRGFFDWSKTDSELTKFYKKLGSVRQSSKAFKSGEFIPLSKSENTLSYIRKADGGIALTAVNNSDVTVKFDLPVEFKNAKPNFSGEIEKNILTLPPFSAEILIVKHP